MNIFNQGWNHGNYLAYRKLAARKAPGEAIAKALRTAQREPSPAQRRAIRAARARGLTHSFCPNQSGDGRIGCIWKAKPEI